MALSPIDWLVVAAYFVVTLGIGFALSRRAGRSMEDFFVSGRSFPWWIAGTSMVATTFAADTPLAVTALVSKHGLAGNWFWWAFAMGGMFTVFIYARLWRRTGVMTDVELIEVRYGGPAAAFLRGFRAVYVAVLVNSIIIGWVTGAMLKVIKILVFNSEAGVADAEGLAILLQPDSLIILGMLAAVGVYSTLSGLWGVAVTDVIQFVLAMGGCIVLAVLAVNQIGGIEALRTEVSGKFLDGSQAFQFLPSWSGESAWMTVDIFLLMLFVQWWATWYPGAEPGGGGYIVQRMASCRDERNAVLATLWYQVAHYCVRPWPWLIVAFVALAQYDLQSLDDPGVGFAMVIRDFAPAGLRGLMLVAFFSAFMSTISTQMNWGASYLVNDVYKRFMAPHAGDKHLANASRIASVIVLVLGAVGAFLMKDVSVDAAWKFLAALGAGTGAVFMLRWFWWRINAYTEIAAMVASLSAFAVIQQSVSSMTVTHEKLLAMTEGQSIPEKSLLLRILETSEYQMAIVAAITIPSWLAVTYLTSPERPEKLISFYRLARPGGPGWRPIAKLADDVQPDQTLGLGIVAALVASLMIYLTIPGLGGLILGPASTAIYCLAGAAACGLVLAWLTPKLTHAEPAEAIDHAASTPTPPHDAAK